MQEIKIPWMQPDIGDDELKEVADSIKAGWLTSGSKVNKFENVLAEYLDVPYAIAVSNGTDALDLALKTVGIKAGDEVILPALTYIATASAVSYQNAIPVFVDIERESFNIDPLKIRGAITNKTKAIIYIDYGGNPAAYDEIKKIAEEFKIVVIQDAAQSLGGIYKGRPLGSQAEISTTSFHMAKVMTTVEGGMIFTHNKKWCEELHIRRNQGESGRKKYEHVLLGTNARMTDLQAGIGLAQFQKLQKMIEGRRQVAETYNSIFAAHHDKITLPQIIHPKSKVVYFLYPILIQNRDDIARTLLQKYGIDTRIAYPVPIYKQPMYETGDLKYIKMECPVAEEVTKMILNLPIYPNMPTHIVNHIGKTLLDEL